MPPQLMQKKKMEVIPVPQEQEKQKIIRELRALESMDFGYHLNLMLKNAERSVFRFWPASTPKPDLYPGEFLCELKKADPKYFERFVAQLNKFFERAESLKARMGKIGFGQFVNEGSIREVYFGHIPRWKAALLNAGERFTAYEKLQQAEWNKFAKEMEEAEKPKRYATISEAKGPGIPYWERPALKVPSTGTNLLLYPGEPWLYVGEGGKPVSMQQLTIQRLREKDWFHMPKKEPMKAEDFFNLIMPVIPALDAAVTEVQTWREKGYQKNGAMKVMLYLAFAGMDMAFMGQLATRTAARATGRQLAVSLTNAGSRRVITAAEKDVFETALRELKPKEIKDLLRLARPSGGKGWSRVMEELSVMAGEKEITGDVLRAYLKEAASEGARRAAWRAKAGTIDFFSNMGFFEREHFRKRVEAEFFNEMRMTIDFDIAKKTMESLAKAKLTQAEQRIASDSVFYVYTSFSRKTQQAFLGLVEKKGWREIIREARKDIVAAKNAKIADSFGSGARSALERMLPQYSRSFHYAPIHRFAEYGVFRYVGGEAVERLGRMVSGYMEEREKKGVGPRPVVTLEDAREAFRKGISERYAKEKY